MDMPYGAIVQQAYVVNDIRAAAEKFNRAFGIGPFVHLPHIKLPNVLYRGQPAEMELSAALCQAGPIQVELIQQHYDGPSCYRDTWPKGQEGFHHVAVMCEDFEKERARYEAMGCPTAMIFGTPETRTCYMDARHLTGGMVELYTDYPGIRTLYRVVSERAANWDGKEILVGM
ncbi:MAG: VOC family protein [Sphingomonadales bacterium]